MLENCGCNSHFHWWWNLPCPPNVVPLLQHLHIQNSSAGVQAFKSNKRPEEELAGAGVDKVEEVFCTPAPFPSTRVSDPFSVTQLCETAQIPVHLLPWIKTSSAITLLFMTNKPIARLFRIVQRRKNKFTCSLTKIPLLPEDLIITLVRLIEQSPEANMPCSVVDTIFKWDNATVVFLYNGCIKKPAPVITVWFVGSPLIEMLWWILVQFLTWMLSTNLISGMCAGGFVWWYSCCIRLTADFNVEKRADGTSTTERR